MKTDNDVRIKGHHLVLLVLVCFVSGVFIGARATRNFMTSGHVSPTR
jgi:hypothetical protein